MTDFQFRTSPSRKKINQNEADLSPTIPSTGLQLLMRTWEAAPPRQLHGCEQDVWSSTTRMLDCLVGKPSSSFASRRRFTSQHRRCMCRGS